MLDGNDITIILAMLSPIYVTIAYNSRKISDLCMYKAKQEQKEEDKRDAMGSY